MVYVKLGASHGESIFMESKIYPQSQEIMTADIEVLFEFIAASVHDFCKPRFPKSISLTCTVATRWRNFGFLKFWKIFKPFERNSNCYHCQTCNLSWSMLFPVDTFRSRNRIISHELVDQWRYLCMNSMNSGNYVHFRFTWIF